MANDILRLAKRSTTPKQVCFADHANDFSPATATDLENSTDNDTCEIQLASVADGAARQSAQVTLEASWLLPEYEVLAAIEFAATPTAGDTVDLYWAPSLETATGTAVGGTGTADAAYTGYSSNLADSLKQLQFIGQFICTAQATSTVQVGYVGRFSPALAVGQLVVVNNSGASIHSDDVETHIVFNPSHLQVQ